MIHRDTEGFREACKTSYVFKILVAFQSVSGINWGEGERKGVSPKGALPNVICCNLDCQALTKFFNLLTKLFNLFSEKAKISSFPAASPLNLAQTEYCSGWRKLPRESCRGRRKFSG